MTALALALPLADLGPSAVLAGIGGGFLIGAFGHLVKSTLVIALGIAVTGGTSLIALVTLLHQSSGT